MEMIKGETKKSRALVFYLMITALVCGALVMVIEVLGSRVIGPFFGASLFIWTSLITVTLVGLAMGYAAGGFLSDRHPSPAFLYGIIFLAGISVHLIPFLRKPVFEISIPLGLRFGALVSSALLFGLPLFLLGAVSPYIIKIAASEIRSIGRTVGVFYSISTFGSFIGTISTGFLLIAYFRVSQIFTFIGWSMIILSVVYFIFFHRRPGTLFLLSVPLLFPAAGDIRTLRLDNGTIINKIFEKDTFYGNIKVLDYQYPGLNVREMLLDGAVQGGIDMANGQPVYGYYYYLQYIPQLLNDSGKRCLVMGLGTGIIPTWYEKRGIRTDVIDINPEIFAAAEKYFGFHISGEKIVEDARYFLNRTDKKYDYIILDVFNGDTMPEHLLSSESLALISRRLSERGVLGINFVGSLRRNSFVTSSVMRTLTSIFRTVDIYPTFIPDDVNMGVGNLEIFAYNFPAVNIDRGKLQAQYYHPLALSARYQIGRRFSYDSQESGTVLTDNYNSLDSREPEVKEVVRKRVQAWTHKDMLY